MPMIFFLWADCGMNFMMQFVNLMRNDPFDIGNFGLCCLSCHDV